MKKKLLAIILCVMLVITFIPTTALAYDYVLNYNDNDFYKMQAFLNQMSDDGVHTNGQILSASYNPDDPSPASWGFGIDWTDGATDKRIRAISWVDAGIKGDLDISGFTSLTSVVIFRTSINSINVSGDSALNFLNIKYNDQLSAATGTNGLASIETVLCSNCPSLTSLNLSGCTSLTLLDARECSIDTLNITGCSPIETLFVSNNKLTGLDVSSFGALTTLECQDNPSITSLTIKGASNLENVKCSDGKIGTLDASGLTKLVYLDCSGNEIETLNLTGDTALEELYCYDNIINRLCVTGFSSLSILDCSNNNLTAIDGIKDTAISQLICNNNEIEELDLSGMSNMLILACYDNKLQSLDLSGDTMLAYAICNNNELTELNTAGDTALLGLVCRNNRLTAMDISESTGLLYIDTLNNHLTSIKVVLSENPVTLTANGDGYVEISNLDGFYANAIPKSGLSFIDWTQSGTEVSTSQKYVLAEDTEYNLTANFGYTVTFDKNGGDTDASPLTKTVVSGEKATAPATHPTKAGLVFDGWYKEAECINKWDFDADTVDANTTLYAKWKEPAIITPPSDNKGGSNLITTSAKSTTRNIDASYITAAGQVSVSVSAVVTQTEPQQSGRNFTVVYLLLAAAVVAGAVWLIVARRRKRKD